MLILPILLFHAEHLYQDQIHTHNIEKNTALLSRNTNWEDILSNDLELSSDDEPTAKSQLPQSQKKKQSTQRKEPMMACKNKCIQTDAHQCSHCTYQKHLILQRQSYIIQDAVNTNKGYSEPVTSREGRHKMPLPSTSAHKRWMEKLTRDIIPRSPKEFTKQQRTPTYTRPEIKVTSKVQ